MPRPSPDLNFISTSVLRTGVCVPHLLLLRWHKRGAVRDRPHLLQLADPPRFYFLGLDCRIVDGVVLPRGETEQGDTWSHR